MKHLQNVLYILTENSYLHCKNGAICVKIGGSDKVKIPAHTIESVICLCNTNKIETLGAKKGYSQDEPLLL